jgi:hypothetical protein
MPHALSQGTSRPPTTAPFPKIKEEEKKKKKKRTTHKTIPCGTQQEKKFVLKN